MPSILLQENQEMVAEALQLEEHEAGRVIYRQGDLGDCFYLIHEGTVAVRKSTQAAERLGPKAFFGEQALLKAEKRYDMTSRALSCDVGTAQPMLTVLHVAGEKARSCTEGKTCGQEAYSYP